MSEQEVTKENPAYKTIETIDDARAVVHSIGYVRVKAALNHNFFTWDEAKLIRKVLRELQPEPTPAPRKTSITLDGYTDTVGNAPGVAGSHLGLIGRRADGHIMVLELPFLEMGYELPLSGSPEVWQPKLYGTYTITVEYVPEE